MTVVADLRPLAARLIGTLARVSYDKLTGRPALDPERLLQRLSARL